MCGRGWTSFGRRPDSNDRLKGHGGCSSVGSSARLWFWMSWVQIPPAAPLVKNQEPHTAKRRFLTFPKSNKPPSVPVFTVPSPNAFFSYEVARSKFSQSDRILLALDLHWEWIVVHLIALRTSDVRSHSTTETDTWSFDPNRNLLPAFAVEICVIRHTPIVSKHFRSTTFQFPRG
jgi:hypothetical protein